MDPSTEVSDEEPPLAQQWWMADDDEEDIQEYRRDLKRMRVEREDEFDYMTHALLGWRPGGIRVAVDPDLAQEHLNNWMARQLVHGRQAFERGAHGEWEVTDYVGNLYPGHADDLEDMMILLHRYIADPDQFDHLFRRIRIASREAKGILMEMNEWDDLTQEPW